MDLNDKKQKNECNLNVPRYVDISELEVDIQAINYELKKIDQYREGLN